MCAAGNTDGFFMYYPQLNANQGKFNLAPGALPLFRHRRNTSLREGGKDGSLSEGAVA